ncbi:CoA transferase [soil metagenome]
MEEVSRVMIEGILSGLKVVDLTQNVAGPFCTQILADLGAEVIKIERPEGGDDTRAWSPPRIVDQSPTFLALNRSKASVCIDFNSPEGCQVLADLAAGADILVHSLKPGSAESRGLGFESLHALNPSLIYCSISAFGGVGPLSKLPGYDPLMQAFTGIMSTTGNDGDDPVRVGVSLIDMGTGVWAALGVLAALIQRGKTGKGAKVEASLLETGVGWMTVFVANYLASGKLPIKQGSAMAMTAPYELFRTADGQVFIAAGNDRLFSRVCEGLGAPQLSQDPRFATNPDRVVNRPELRSELEALTSSWSSGEVVKRLRAAGAPCSEMNSVAEMVDHEQVQAMDLVRPLPTPGAPGHRAVALPFTIDGDRGATFRPAPGLGADTARILGGLGYSQDKCTALRESGAIN